jgi:hypothetical protein
VGEEHSIDPKVDNLALSELMFAEFDDRKRLGVIMSRLCLDVVVVVITDFTVCCH